MSLCAPNIGIGGVAALHQKTLLYTCLHCHILIMTTRLWSFQPIASVSRYMDKTDPAAHMAGCLCFSVADGRASK